MPSKLNKLIVLKFGGSVLRDQKNLNLAVHEVYRWRREGYRVIAVVSALAGVTDELLRDSKSWTESNSEHKVAAHLAKGEHQSAATLGQLLDVAGVPNQVLKPRSIDLCAESFALDAHPVSVRTQVVADALNDDCVVVIPGYVAIDKQQRTVVLGRGGSDLSALFLASALKADRCRLIKDVDGLYEQDPSLKGVTPRRYETASWEDAQKTDGTIIQHKAIAFAKKCALNFELGMLNGKNPTRIGAYPRRCGPAQKTLTPIRVVLLGYGTVGKGVFDGLRLYPEAFDIRAILVRNKKTQQELAPDLLSRDIHDEIRNADLVIEALGGLSPASELIELALNSGADVVTANKTLIAESGQDFAQLASAKKRDILFSAAVGGSLPLIEILSQIDGPIESIRGVLNGTINFIVDKLRGGTAFDAALRAAQKLGFAEADASRDLLGLDLSDKLEVIAHALKTPLKIRSEDLQSLDELRLSNTNFSADPSLRIRQVARLSFADESNRARVSFESLTSGDPLFGCHGEDNCVEIRTKYGHSLVIRGKGAGRGPTAESVLGDVLQLVRSRHHNLHTMSDEPITAERNPAATSIQPVLDRIEGLANGNRRRNPKRRPKIALLGASGAVGTEVLKILAERGYDEGLIGAFASAQSAGKKVPFGTGQITLREFGANDLVVDHYDVAVLALSAELAKQVAPLLIGFPCRVVDTSSAFRHQARVPLVIPEVNAELVDHGTHLVASPNCSTILMVMACAPIRAAFGIRRIVVSTYQAVSGAGKSAISELEQQVDDFGRGIASESKVFPELCAFNVFAHESVINEETAFNGEEEKLMNETQRIWPDSDLEIIPTCARVPTIRSHCLSLTLWLRKSTTRIEVEELLSKQVGVRLVRQSEGLKFPSALSAEGQDEVQVGRVRMINPDSSGRSICLSLWIAGDQLRKGAALNALQIVDLLETRKHEARSELVDLP